MVDYCDGWIPIGVRAGDLTGEIGALRRLAEEKGRDPSSISVNVYGAPADREVLAPPARRRRHAGDLRPAARPGAEKVVSLLDRYAEVVQSLAS